MDEEVPGRQLRLRRSDASLKNSIKIEQAATRKRILTLIGKSDDILTAEDKLLLSENENLVKVLKRNQERKDVRFQRLKEIEESDADVLRKCQVLATALRESSHPIVYTGAGISTSANIPDYRGPAGVWTLMKGGKKIPVLESFTSLEPTQSHMCLRKLFNAGVVKHVVSQNCDGLHLRSGLPSNALSEIHGNMYVEICQNCNGRVYHRIFDVTGKTSLHRHKTGRFCNWCDNELRDTIVHFGEKSNLRWPHNWDGAVSNAEECDMILCLGTSLKVLRSYKQLWLMRRPKCKRPDLYIVNLQWTPKDSQAKLKINARVDHVLTTILEMLDLNVPVYNHEEDPLLSLSTSCVHNGKTISIPKTFEPKFCPLEAPTDDTRSIRHPSIKEEKNEKNGEEVNSKTIEQGKSGHFENGGEPCSEDVAPAPPSWFGKGVRVRQTSSKCKRRRRSVKHEA